MVAILVHQNRCACTEDDDCLPGRDCIDGLCQSKQGQVLLKSITLNISDCVGCSEENEGVYLQLLGQRTLSYKEGIPCETKKLDNLGLKDFGSNSTPVFDGQQMLGSCYEVSSSLLEYIYLHYISFFCN